MNTNHGRKDGARQEGFALVLAILTLLVLTFLGLSLVATTSTEQQIATNYRWSQQALYNAEAGLEVGKVLLRDANGLDWTAVLPVARAAAWSATGTPPPLPALPPNPATGTNIRNFENAACDRSGGAVGYGVILNDNTPLHSFGAVQYQSTILGQSLSGAFTLWVRHKVKYNTPAQGQNSDDPNYDQLVLTSEGIAPYTPTAGGTMSTLARTNAAVKVLEVEMRRGVTDPCPDGTVAQQGLGPTGNNNNRCAPPLGTGCGAGGGLAPLGDASRSQNVAQQGGSGAAGGCGNNPGAGA